MADRADLPQLESVEGSAYGTTLRSGRCVLLTLIAMCLISLTAAGYGVNYILKQKELGLEMLLIIMLMAISIALIIAIGKLIATDFYWKTDQNGLFIRGLLRKRFVSWSDVSGFELGGTVSTKLFLKTSTGIILVPIEDWPSNAVGASTLQHLNWHNMEECEKEFPSEVLDYWNMIPENTPREVTWKSKRKSPMIFALFIACSMVSMFVFGAITSYLWKGLKEAAWFASPMLITLWIDTWHGQLRRALDTARQLSVDRYGINAVRTRSSLSMHWEKIGEYDISYQDNEVYVTLQSKPDKRRLIVELDERDPSSKLALLSIIRRLKEMHPSRAIPVPSALITKEPETEDEPPLWLQQLREESSERENNS